MLKDTELATYYNTSWLDTIKGRTHANSSTVNGIGSTYSIEEICMTIHQAYIIVYTHSFLYMGSTLIIHLVAVVIWLESITWMTVLLESLEQMILVGINQQLRYTIHQTIVMTMIVPNLGIMYQTLHSNVLLFRRLYTNMIQDVVLDLECDKNQYALRGHTSNKSTFTMMIHISDTQQCDYMHNSTEHTTDTIRINTCDNGDMVQSLLKMGSVHRM